MPCIAITFGHAPQAAHRLLSQFATMASRTRKAGRLAGWDFNTFSARLTLFRQAFRVGLSITTRNKTLTQNNAGPVTTTGSGAPRGRGRADRRRALNHGKRGCTSRLTVVFHKLGMRRVVAPKPCAFSALSIACSAAGFAGHGAAR